MQFLVNTRSCFGEKNSIPYFGIPIWYASFIIFQQRVYQIPLFPVDAFVLNFDFTFFQEVSHRTFKGILAETEFAFDHFW